MQELSIFGMTFAHPWLLLLLLMVPVLAFLRGRFGGTPAVIFSTTEVLANIGRRRQSRAGDFLAALSYLALVCLLVAIARPQVGRTVTRTQASGVDIMLVLDVSRSMLAEDFTIGNQRANRIDATRRVTERFINSRPNDRLGIIAFAGNPYLVSPLTLDHAWLIKNLERVRIGLVEDGTAIGSAIVSAATRLKDKPADSKLIVLLTDGDNNAGKIEPMTAAEAAKALGIRIYTVGAGSRGAVPFPFTDPFGNTVYQMANMEFDETTLQQIASITGGKYFRATDSRSLNAVFEDIDRLEKSTVEIEQTVQYRDLFPWFLLAALAALLLEIILSQTLWRRLP